MIQNRINQLFVDKKKNILSVYFTAGYPGPDDTVTIIRELEKNGVSLIEIGMPFSDPVADGPVIQQSSHTALTNGMSIKRLFEQLQHIREQVKIPLILMGYLNPVLQFGLENFCQKCAETGIDGLILPDLPLDVYREEFRETFEKYGLHNILLITPQTTEKRLHEIDDASTGFIYMVSSSATTGVKNKVSDFLQDYFDRIRQMQLKNPRLIGFGISNRETFENACQYAHGAIIGSAFVKALEAEGKLEDKIAGFVKSIRVVSI
ncbi:MAG: tryptophan synthase subunit alpha [Prolixibacteraceae bacterium]